MAGPIAELVRGGGIDTRFPSQENGEAEEDANSDEAEIPATKNYPETGNHASVPTTRKRKSKGKAQNAKGKSKVERTSQKAKRKVQKAKVRLKEQVKRQNAKCKSKVERTTQKAKRKRQKYNPKNDFPG